jgi:ribokinase
VSGRVIVVGSVNVDLVVSGERLPAPGETVTDGTFQQFHGGKGGNQAVAAARLGAETWFIGAVGDDPFGAEARAALEMDDVRTDHVVTVPEAATGIALILVDSHGENLISVAGGANLELTAGHVGAALGAIRPVHGDVLLVGHEIVTLIARAALETARLKGATTVLNPAPVGDLDRRTFGLADHLTPNRGELAALVANDARSAGPAAGLDEPERAARRLLDPGAAGDGVRRSVLVSLGAGGAILVRRDQPALDIQALRVVAVDTVGAGDTLNGAFAAALARGESIESAAREAVLAASVAVIRAGAREGMPTADDLAELRGQGR